MAETTNTRPTRARAARPAAPAKAAPAKSAKPAAKEESSAAATPTRFTVEAEHLGATKSYEKFGFATGAGVVGNVYAPLGTHTVKVLVIGADDAGDAPE